MSGYTPLAEAAGRALEPLAAALADPGACARLLDEVGLPELIDDEALEIVRDLVGAADDLAQLPGLLAGLDGAGAGDAAELVAMVARIAAALGGLASVSGDDVAALPGRLSSPEAWVYLAGALPDHLLSRRLERSAPALLASLRLLGLGRSEGPVYAPRTRWRWDELGSALADPVAAVKASIGWGDRFAAWALQRELGLALARLGLGVQVRALSPAVAAALGIEEASGPETGVVMFRGELPTGTPVETGLVLACSPGGGGTIFVGNQVNGELSEPVPLGGAWSLDTAGALDGTATLGVRIDPGGVTLVGGSVALGASIGFDGRPESPWVLVGSPGGTRLELEGARLEAGIAGAADAPDAYVLGSVEDGALRLVLDLGAADGFLRGVIGGFAPAVTAGGELRWGTRSGLAFGGGLGLEVTRAIALPLGPLYVHSLTLALGASTTGASMAATVVADVTIGPVVGSVQGVGAALALARAGADDGELGGLAAQLDFVPPTGLGLAVDAAGVVTGGGFLDLDHEAGRYSGVASLQLLSVGLTATGIVETKLPGDPDGWSLFLSIIADFTPLPLGFGFTLNGVGGFAGLHRTLDELALAQGVLEGRLDSVMFPEDAAANATQILADVQAFFPTRQDHHTFGAMVKIGWGSPTLITAELGVILTVPDFELAVVGEIGTVLPRADLPLLELHMGVAGFIDVAEGTLWLIASIHDSRLVQFALSGDMALYASVGEQPYFLLSVGGFHPGWSAPAAVPVSMRSLRRMSAAIDLGEGLEIGLESYFAVTSNTLQFGAEVFARAAVRAVGVDFSADGWFGFDVLVTFSPFTLRADMSAGVAVRAEGELLLGVQMELHVEGPEPWFGSGFAEFEFMGFDARIQVEVGGHAEAEAVATVMLWPLLEAALADPASWAAPPPPAALRAVTLRALDPVAESGLWLESDGQIEVRQRVVPLNREIEAYGTQGPEGESRFDVEAAGVAAGASVARTPAQDWFAPAQFTVMSAAERLDAPSFELMDAGVTMAAEGLSVPPLAADAASVALAHEEKVVLDEGGTRSAVRPLRAKRPLGRGGPARRRAGAAAGARYAVAAQSLAVGPTRFLPVDAGTARMTWSVIAAAPGPLRQGGYAYADALLARRALNDGAGLRIVPRHANAGAGAGMPPIDFDPDLDLDLPGPGKPAR